MSQPLLGGGEDHGALPSGFGHQAEIENIYACNQGPLPIESLDEFYLGSREDLRVTVT
jgi:hypothetical protein